MNSKVQTIQALESIYESRRRQYMSGKTEEKEKGSFYPEHS